MINYVFMWKSGTRLSQFLFSLENVVVNICDWISLCPACVRIQNSTVCWSCRWRLCFGLLWFIAHPSVAPCLTDLSAPLTCWDIKTSRREIIITTKDETNEYYNLLISTSTFDQLFSQSVKKKRMSFRISQSPRWCFQFTYCLKP